MSRRRIHLSIIAVRIRPPTTTTISTMIALLLWTPLTAAETWRRRRSSLPDQPTVRRQPSAITTATTEYHLEMTSGRHYSLPATFRRPAVRTAAESTVQTARRRPALGEIRHHIMSIAGEQKPINSDIVPADRLQRGRNGERCVVRSWMALLHVICPLLWIVAGSNILHMYLRNHCNHYCILNNYQNKKNITTIIIIIICNNVIIFLSLFLFSSMTLYSTRRCPGPTCAAC